MRWFCIGWKNLLPNAAYTCRAFAHRKNSWKYETMKADPILEELWRVKDQLSREMAADPAAYFAKLDKITNAEEKAGRKVIRSAEELRQLMAEKERQRVAQAAMVLNDKPPRKKR